MCWSIFKQDLSIQCSHRVPIGSQFWYMSDMNQRLRVAHTICPSFGGIHLLSCLRDIPEQSYICN